MKVPLSLSTSPILQGGLRSFLCSNPLFMVAMHRHRRSHKLFRELRDRATEKGPVREVISAAEASVSPTNVPFSKPPSSVAAVASVVSVVGALIMISFGFVLWKRRNRRRQAEQVTSVQVARAITEKEHVKPKNIDVDNVAIYMEMPEKALFASNSADMQAGWVPQIRSQRQHGVVDVYTPDPTPKVKNTMRTRPLQLTVTPPSGKLCDLRNSLPPSYNTAAAHHPIIPIPPPIISAIVSPPSTPPTPCSPFTPPISRKFQTSFTTLSDEVSQAPKFNPRSESFITNGFVTLSPEPNKPEDNLGKGKNSCPPRLMNVTTSFVPNLPDELSIETGTSVRMLEEYCDGWCLVQRIGEPDASKGVVPGFCLQEREAVPMGPTHRWSNHWISSGRRSALTTNNPSRPWTVSL